MKELDEYSIFAECHDTLKATSVDDHEAGKVKYMTSCEYEVVNFDKVKEKYAKGLKMDNVPMSNDALFCDREGNPVFVEFKAGRIRNSKEYEIRKKIYDSILLFGDITKMGISDTRDCMRYILVYNEKANQADEESHDQNDDIEYSCAGIKESEAFTAFSRGVNRLAKGNFARFGVGIFKKYCFKDVYTWTEEEFEEYLTAGGMI